MPFFGFTNLALCLSGVTFRALGPIFAFGWTSQQIGWTSQQSNGTSSPRAPKCNRHKNTSQPLFVLLGSSLRALIGFGRPSFAGEIAYVVHSRKQRFRTHAFLFLRYRAGNAWHQRTRFFCNDLYDLIFRFFQSNRI